MSVPIIKSSFAAGELSPSMLGRADHAKYAIGNTTCRNFFVHYDGPAWSRAGTAFVGFSKQTGRNYPPRLITFQFSVNQGVALEFGNFYMRPIVNGAFVTETPVAISNITQANPAVVTIPSATGATAATPNVGAVTTSYAPGDTVLLAGGVFSQQTKLLISTTKLLSLSVDNQGGAFGNSYAPGDSLTLTGGVQTSGVQLTVLTTSVVSAALGASGTGTGNGTALATGTTGTGTKFQCGVTVVAGAVTGVIPNSIIGGSYTVNPVTSPLGEPVTISGFGISVTGCSLMIGTGLRSFSITGAGTFTTNPSGGTFTQTASSGAGTGATFQFALMGPRAATIATAGSYSVYPSNPVAEHSTSGGGVGATWTVTTGAVPHFQAGDWLFFEGVGGMTEFNNATYVATSSTNTTVTLQDVYGNPVDSTGFHPYTSGGTVARLYTLTTQYAEADLPWLKFTQSADVMTICCVNQDTLTEYPSLDLERLADDLWEFVSSTPGPTVSPPPFAPGISPSTSGLAAYAYCITSVGPDGTESIASPIGAVGPGFVDIASTAGTVTVSNWGNVPGVNQYNVYKATPAISGNVPTGAQYGYAGSAYGQSWVDDNVTPDFTQVPPTHQNPFARGPITGVTPLTGGSGYTVINYTVNTSTGSGFIANIILNGTSLAAFIIVDEGHDYAPSDTITITGNGSGATAKLSIGPQTGTYPGVPGYFQERRGFGNSLNNPDTYWFSQPGSFTNFDSRLPPVPSDAIEASPWAIQVNGVQWFIQMPAGLLIMTGSAAWLLAGVGSFATNVQAITPTSQNDVPQAFSGCSPLIQPVKIQYDILFVEQKGSRVYALPYQLYSLSEPIDVTDVSAHLLDGYTVVQSAWCEQPYKNYWVVRNDGALLSLTWYKPQALAGWARHDTNGLFVGCCSVTELPVDALYLATQRFPGSKTAYMIERMDDRIWPDVESAWCVDCGLRLSQPEPVASLTISSQYGLGSITGATGLVGGAGYSAATTAAVVDRERDANGNPYGSGAVPTLTIVAGVITGVTFSGGNQGSGYRQPLLVITDPAGSAGGSGASARLTLNNAATATASAAVFSAPNVGSFIRAAGGIAAITAVIDTQHVAINILSPFVQLPPGPIPSGSWTMTAPVSTIGGLLHLAGATVTGLADGNVIPPTVVSAGGQITLPAPASAVTVGLGFQAQLQAMPIDAGQPTIQGQRKKVAAVTVRLQASRGVTVGANQQDGSTLSPPSLAPTWSDMQALPDSGPNAPNFPEVPYNALATPLRTGDVRSIISSGLETTGQIAVQQNNPLPCQVLCLVSEVLPGDTVQTQAPQKKGRG